MIDKKEFNSIASDLDKLDDLREKIIKTSRDILKLSKKAIYSTHKSDLNYSKKNIEQAKKLIVETDKLIQKNSELKEVGAFNDALQEYCEAVCYYEYMKNNRIPTRKELNLSITNYLLGICDLTGELARLAVFLTIDKKYDKVKEIYNTVNEIYGKFLNFNLKNGELRRKSDSIKYNLKKIEEIMYDIAKK